MRVTDSSPPPFFKRGLPPLARLAIFASLSLLLMVLDGHFRYLNTMRSTLAIVINPLQHAMNAPVQLAGKVGDFFVTQGRLKSENADLKEQQLQLAGKMLQYQSLQAENTHLRNLLGARARMAQHTTLAEILYTGRDPFARKIIVDRGSLHGVEAGQVVTDQNGVIGQVTRATPAVSEVTLITDKEQAVPVQNVRNGLRAVVFGSGEAGTMNMPFMPFSADLQPGDQLVTSGIDGTYPAGLPVAVITKVERNAADLFAKITCAPSSGPDRHRQVLIISAAKTDTPVPPPPPPEEKPTAKASRGKR